MTTDRMPTSEELERWAYLCTRVADSDHAGPLAMPPSGNSMTHLAAFLTSPQLKAALELAEASAWIEIDDRRMMTRCYTPSKGTTWLAVDTRRQLSGDHAPTFAAAVAALLGKVEGQ